ncbi:MAG: epoxyqueuosine reductase QueH [Bacteroides xylanisolvens]
MAERGLSERRIAIIKEYNFYNQQYCGCEFSMRKKNKTNLSSPANQ